MEVRIEIIQKLRIEDWYAQIPDTDYRKDVFLKDAPNSNTSAANGQGGWANNTNPLYTTEAEFDAAIDQITRFMGLDI